MHIPDFTTFAMKYTATDEVTVGKRVFHIKIVVESNINYWPLYDITDKTDDSQAGMAQRKAFSPIRNVLLRETMNAIRNAGWSIDTNTYILEAPMSHLRSALTTVQTGDWK